MFFSYACKLAFYLLAFQSQQLVYQPHKNFDGTTIYKSETASYTTLTSTGDKPACLACYFSQLACSNQLLSGNPSCSVVNKFNCTLLKEQLQVEKQLKGEKYSVQFFLLYLLASILLVSFPITVVCLLALQGCWRDDYLEVKN